MRARKTARGFPRTEEVLELIFYFSRPMDVFVERRHAKIPVISRLLCLFISHELI